MRFRLAFSIFEFNISELLIFQRRLLHKYWIVSYLMKPENTNILTNVPVIGWNFTWNYCQKLSDIDEIKVYFYIP